MKSLLLILSCAAIAVAVSGCLVSPVGKSGGIGSVTVTNSSPTAIVAAAQSAFSQSGYQIGLSDFPTSVSFDKGSNQFANVVWGSYGDPQTIRVRVMIAQIPGTNDYRLTPKVYSVSDAGEAGFDDPRPLAGLWAAEFGPTLRSVAAQAANAGALTN